MNARRLMKKRGSRASAALRRPYKSADFAVEIHRAAVSRYLATRPQTDCVAAAKAAGVDLSDAPYGPSAYGRPRSEAWAMLDYASRDLPRGYPRGSICRT